MQGKDGAMMKNSQSVQFTSELIPMYADPYDIREIALGYITDDIPDFIIAKMIHTNSKNVAIMYGIDYYSSDSIPASTYNKMVNYVKCKTAYDLLRSPLIGGASFGGRIAGKSLGDLSISYDFGTGTKPPVQELKDELKSCYESSSVVDITAVGVKSKDDQYYPGRRRDITRIIPTTPHVVEIEDVDESLK